VVTPVVDYVLTQPEVDPRRITLMEQRGLILSSSIILKTNRHMLLVFDW
jgi:hypothetical protein